jgi:hypothetical protein
MAKTERITAKRLRELLNYDPKTGIFVWRVRRHGITIGAIAGSIDRDSYRRIKIDYKQYNASHLACLWMTGMLPPAEMDHINGIPADDRWCNLRPASHIQNLTNRRRMGNSTNPFKGIKWDSSRSKWQARITIEGRVVALGRFNTPKEAHAAYVEAAKKHFGEFFRPE